MSSNDHSNAINFQPCSDPYDLWSTDLGITVRRRYYAEVLLGKAGAVGIGVLDWLLPDLGRRLTGAAPRYYPIVVAHEIMLKEMEGNLGQVYAGQVLDLLSSIASQKGNESGWSWGLGFPWMSKNGLYGPEVPFVTHTPYVMEALLKIAGDAELHHDAMDMFRGTWTFIESLKVMFEDGKRQAFSYAPVDEPRIVVNANAYAAFAYSLHAKYGKSEHHKIAKEKINKIICWVASQQNDDGSWFYYADKEPGNFVDCFHSCFVVKNLLKVARINPQLSSQIHLLAQKGWAYIRNELYDSSVGLCRRFAVRAQKDPFRWDMYDQAEYLGLLLDFGLVDEATEFADRVERRFRKGDHWYCRIDIFGRRWGKDYQRWGIVPFWYQKARLNQARGSQ